MENWCKNLLLLITISALIMEHRFVDCSDPKETQESAEDHVEVDSSKIEYAKGSVCGYCSYCKVFTPLCAFFAYIRMLF